MFNKESNGFVVFIRFWHCKCKEKIWNEKYCGGFVGAIVVKNKNNKNKGIETWSVRALSSKENIIM